MLVCGIEKSLKVAADDASNRRDASGAVNCAETLDGNVVLETLSLSLTVLLSLALGNAVTANLFFSSRWRLELKGHPSGPRTNQLLNDCK